MEAQQDLFRGLNRVPRRPRDYRRDAREWRERYPEAWRILESIALHEAERGRPFGMKLVAERFRWHVLEHVKQCEELYKINNNLVSYMARMLIQDHPRLKGLLRFREVRFWKGVMM